MSEASMGASLKLRTRPLMRDFGAEILDVDVARAEPEILAAVVATFHRHGAIVLRGNIMGPADQVAFTRLFGEPEIEHGYDKFIHPDFPEIFIISNKIVNGRKIGDHEVGQNWHTDNSYGRRPALCTMLHAMEVPDEGSDTLLADLCAAWNALPQDRQDALEGLSGRYSFQSYMRRRGLEMTPEQMAAMPDVYHPIVRRHPADGRKVLWISSGIHDITGMETTPARRLVDELVKFATQEQFVYRHKWRVGDTLIWDNRCTLHTGTPFDTEKYIRYVHRTWVQGEIPQ
jgi:taurine dioxygenase